MLCKLMKTLFPFIILTLMISCNSSDGVTESNYSFKIHIDQEGELPQVGDKVFFHEKVFHNYELISSTYGLGEKEIILPSKENLSKPIPPTYEILLKMSPGDSMSVTQELSDFENLPKGYEKDDDLKYIIKLLRVIPKSEF